MVPIPFRGRVARHCMTRRPAKNALEGYEISAIHARVRAAHPLAVRLMNSTGVNAVRCMNLSGWQICHASPSLPLGSSPG